MIYEEPRFLPGGDRYLLIEFGDEMNLELNFRGQDLAHIVAEQKTKGVLETAPCFASTLIHYDPELISFTDLKKEMASLLKGLRSTDDIVLPSRLFCLPTVYLDPWTQECIADYIAKIAKKKPDPEYLAELNGLSGFEQLVRVHSGTEYWVVSLGFWPGLPFTMPLDPRCRLVAPKYNPPRTWTPKGSVGMGGMSTAIYPEDLPGGYQIFGRTPVPIWDPEKRFAVFENSICLFRPGDRIRFVPCSIEEFEYVEARVADGSYQYNLVEYQQFSVAQYKKWVAGLDETQRF